MHRWFRVLAVVVSVFAALQCGGSSSPAAPATTTTPTASALTVGSISPSAPTVSTTAQTITVIGTGFAAGLTLTITPPMPPPTSLMTFTGSQITALTSTSFQVSGILALPGTYSVQVTSSSGEKSNTATFASQLRTSGTTWIPEGVRVNGADVGGPIANCSALRLLDGRWRLYFGTGGSGIRSAVSNDGLAFSIESGTRLSGGNPRLLRLDDGRVRMFYTAGNSTGFGSAISTDDGVTFSVEPGDRLSAASAGLASITNPGIVRVGGIWRAYFSQRSVDVVPGAQQVVKSATSSDLLNWTMDGGVRFGPGSTISAGAAHPVPLLNNDGTVTVYYARTIVGNGGGFFLFASTSTDGLTFTTEAALESLGKGNDPDIVRTGGSLRLYYGWGDAATGTLYSAISASGNPQSFIRR